MNVPDAVGVPLTVITLADQAAVTPAGNPVGLPMPVAPVVAYVMFVKAVLIHKVGVLDAAPAVFKTATVTAVEETLTLLQVGAVAVAVIISPAIKAVKPVLVQDPDVTVVVP